MFDVYYWHSFYPLGECVDSDKQKPKPFWCPRQNAHDVDSLDCKRPGEIDRLKRIGMLCNLLLEELTITAFGDDVHLIILSDGPVEFMSECFTDDRTL
jgi:hypothetical protein